MKKLMITSLALALFTGCASIERTSPGIMDGLDVMGGDSPAESTVVVRSSGYTLFYWITAICGNIGYNAAKHDIEGGVLMFTDRATTADCYRTLQAAASDEGKKLTNVSVINNTLPSPGLTGYLELAGWFIETDDVIASGVFRAK